MSWLSIQVYHPIKQLGPALKFDLFHTDRVKLARYSASECKDQSMFMNVVYDQQAAQRDMVIHQLPQASVNHGQGHNV